MSTWTITQWAIAVVVVIAIVALVYLAANVMGVAIPGWIVTVFWICAAAFIIIGAIKLVSRLFVS